MIRIVAASDEVELSSDVVAFDVADAVEVAYKKKRIQDIVALDYTVSEQDGGAAGTSVPCASDPYEHIPGVDAAGGPD